MTRLRTEGIPALVGPVCLLILCGILVAGLWPFERPRNAVSWIENENGLRFGDFGTVLSAGALQAPSSLDETSCSVEIWLQPGPTTDVSTLAAFSTPENPQQLTLEQYHADFLLAHRIKDHSYADGVIGLNGLFSEGEPRFITITSNSEHTTVYVNGVFRERFLHFVSARDLVGELVIGTSPVVDEHWWGKLRGLAIYGGELTAGQVLENYQGWTVQGRPALSGSEQATALYTFDEHVGNVIHNAIRPGIDLYIPERFSLLHQPVLKAFWKEYKTGWSYWKDILINVAGFVPFGFFFYAYWSSVKPIKHAALVTVVLGLAVSLTIEVTQAYLPTRASDTTDVITNTLGTCVGVVAYGLGIGRKLLAKAS
jgi:hypothetical protein